jgi:phosphoribosylamine--glycine ligase
MKVGIIGSGGREHAICHTLNKSKKVDKIYCFPGNAGTSLIAENTDLELDNFEKLKDFILEKEINLIIVGPEQPLVDGITDYLEKFKIKVFGPNKIASQLEGSKIFTKNICKRYNIPTANFGVFKSQTDSNKFLDKSKFPIVIKADNLASGKGVYICENKEQSYKAIKEIFDGKFGVAKNVLIEEFLKGEEMSFFIVSDGNTYQNFGTAQDHKRVMEGDKGKNTGGMGAYSPSRLINKELEKKILAKIINPTLKAIKDLGTVYKGFLYAGLMIVNNEPFLIEYNVRMGDPECQTLLPKLDTDLFDILNSCCDNELSKIEIRWNNKKSLCIVMCSKGYPDTYKKNIEIKNIDFVDPQPNDFLFHAGTVLKNNSILSNGGRVLNFVSQSDNFLDARNNIYRLINNLNWPGGFYRKDIGYKVIDE